jgi:lipid-binding SYLF domain-containing protein
MTFATAMTVESRVAHADPEQTVQSADQVLREVMAIPGKQIPQTLLAEARGVAIIPNVIKVGFIAGVRRGQGVVVVRDADGEWSLPQFVTLTGGSVGWQAGVQGSDVILVFMTPASVEGLMSGKFTIGADAAAAAGPIGRNAAAATDGKLKAEILSYSRSRGLFAGLALDGSVIEVDNLSHTSYYGATSAQLPIQIPASAAKLRVDLTSIAQAGTVPVEQLGVTAVHHVPERIETLRQSLRTNSMQLNALLDPTWQQYLALPREVYEGNHPPSLESLQRVQQQFAQVAQSPQYKPLADRPEFQSTYELLQAFTSELAQMTQPKIALPPPPPG